MDRQTMLKRVQVADFVLYEARLFLDTHPTDKTALEYFKKHQAQAETARKDFEAKYGPLMAENSQNEECWDWVCDPWPWENTGRDD